MMDKIISDHRQILDEIKGILARKCKEEEKDINVSEKVINNEIINIIYKCSSIYSEKIHDIYLHFEIWRNNPQSLKFNSYNRLVLSDKSNNYDGLTDAVIETIESQINN